MSAREESLAHRERQIALQQQIMSEEYRSLRQQRADRLASVPPGRNTAAAGLSRFREEASLGTALAPDRPAVRPGSRAQTLTIG